MTPAEMRQAILNAIQTDAGLIALIRLSATRSINTVLSDEQLAAIVAALQLQGE